MKVFDKEYEVVPGILTPSECEDFIKELDKIPGEINPEESRKSFKLVLNPTSKTAYDFIKKLSERIINLGYSDIAYFVDSEFNCMQEGDSILTHPDWVGYVNGNVTVTIVIYLSNLNDYEGGHIEFPDLNVSLRPEQGSIVIFRPVENHAVAIVTSGIRYTGGMYFSDEIIRDANPYNFY